MLNLFVGIVIKLYWGFDKKSNVRLPEIIVFLIYFHLSTLKFNRALNKEVLKTYFSKFKRLYENINKCILSYSLLFLAIETL